MIITTSPIVALWRGRDDFQRCCKVFKYSRLQRAQKWSPRSGRGWHQRRRAVAERVEGPQSESGLGSRCPNRRCHQKQAQRVGC